MSQWWRPSPSNQIQPVPWLAPRVVEHLEKLIQPDWEIIEHGSGGSTLWFAARCKSVVSFEHDPDWQRQVKDKAPENVTVLSGLPETEKQFDLLLIDGEPVEARAEWLQWSARLVRPGGWIVLDNANRPEYADERRRLMEFAAEHHILDGNESGTRYLVTEFFKVPELKLDITFEHDSMAYAERRPVTQEDLEKWANKKGGKRARRK